MSRQASTLGILGARPEDRGAETWAAIMRELARGLAVFHRSHDITQAPPTDDPNMHTDYYMDLIVAAGQSRDPAVIPLLIDSDPVAPVSSVSKEQIVRAAREVWSSTSGLDGGDTIAMASLALSTGDADLRRLLEQFAVDAGYWRRRGMTNENDIQRAQELLTIQLKKYPRP